MRYFCIEQDISYTPKLVLNGLHNIAHNDDFTLERSYLVPDHQVVFPIPKKNNQYVDVLSEQFFLVTEMVRDVFRAYSSDMKYKTFCVIDNEYKVYEYYYAPILSSIAPVRNQRCDALHFNSTMVEGKHVFRADIPGTNSVVVSLEIVESLLRRSIIGAVFVPVVLTNLI